MLPAKNHDVVITVPPFFTEIERKTIITAAGVAGLDVLTLVNDGIAIAQNYATFRIFSSTKQYSVILDIGAGSTTATLVSFQTREIKISDKAKKDVSSITVEGIGYDRFLGGQNLDLELIKIMASAFEKTNKFENVLSDPSVYSKLRKEANRVKHVLSANTQGFVSVQAIQLNLSNYRLMGSSTALILD